jgi:hypothetical protein
VRTSKGIHHLNRVRFRANQPSSQHRRMAESDPTVVAHVGLLRCRKRMRPPLGAGGLGGRLAVCLGNPHPRRMGAHELTIEADQTLHPSPPNGSSRRWHSALGSIPSRMLPRVHGPTLRSGTDFELSPCGLDHALAPRGVGCAAIDLVFVQRLFRN